MVACWMPSRRAMVIIVLCHHSIMTSSTTCISLIHVDINYNYQTMFGEAILMTTTITPVGVCLLIYSILSNLLTFSSLTPTFSAYNTMNNPYQSQVPHLPISSLLVTPQTPVCMAEWHRFLNYTHPPLIIQPI